MLLLFQCSLAVITTPSTALRQFQSGRLSQPHKDQLVQCYRTLEVWPTEYNNSSTCLKFHLDIFILKIHTLKSSFVWLFNCGFFFISILACYINTVRWWKHLDFLDSFCMSSTFEVQMVEKRNRKIESNKFRYNKLILAFEQQPFNLTINLLMWLITKTIFRSQYVCTGHKWQNAGSVGLQGGI